MYKRQVYETSYVEHEEIYDLESWDYVTFTSKSCVDGFVNTQKGKDFAGIRALCIGCLLYTSKHERFNRLVDLINAISAEKNGEYAGRVERVLVEGASKTNSKTFSGRTDGLSLIHI